MLWNFRPAGEKTIESNEARTAAQSAIAENRVLLATVDHDMRNSISQHLREYSIATVCVKAIGEVRAAFAKERFAACFSGFWLVDGTYRDVFRHLKRQALEAPMVLVCGPSCTSEYRDYLASLKIRAFEFICHPYRKSDLERILRPILGALPGSARQATRHEPYSWDVPAGGRYPAKA